MILQKGDLEQRLRWHLGRAVSVDIATAFVGDASTKLLHAVIDYARRDDTTIRVIVGAMHKRRNSEDHTRQAIRSLAGQGVSIREHNESFHAKAYIFHHADVTHAWVGSNNLTKKAFRYHDELALETCDKTDVGKLEAWFEDRWGTAALREIRSFSIFGGTSVALSSGGANVDCRFKTAYVNARSSRSFYWNTTWLRDDAIRENTRVSVPRDAATDEPILGTVELHNPINGGHGAEKLLRACRASERRLRLRIGPERGGAYCDASVARLHHSDDQTNDWGAVLDMASYFRK